jgi:hypothetical protein
MVTFINNNKEEYFNITIKKGGIQNKILDLTVRSRRGKEVRKKKSTDW